MKNTVVLLMLSILFLFQNGYPQNIFTQPEPLTEKTFKKIYIGAPDLKQVAGLSGPKGSQQNEEANNVLAKRIPWLYAHIYGGMGVSLLFSTEIKKLLGDDFGIGMGLPDWSWGGIVGFKNIIQVEYNNGISDHDFNNNSIIKDIPSKVIKMDYKTNDLQLKFNPLFWTSAQNKAYFLIFGKGDVEWIDKNNDGFQGTSQIIGVEYFWMSRFTSWSVSFKRYGLTLDKTIIFNIPFETKTKAANYLLEFKLGFGFGI